MVSLSAVTTFITPFFAGMASRFNVIKQRLIIRFILFMLYMICFVIQIGKVTKKYYLTMSINQKNITNFVCLIFATK